MSDPTTWPSPLQVIDSHTAGEPTRVVIAKDFDLGGGSVQEQSQVFAQRYDDLRKAVIQEPRGAEILVGAWLCKPQAEDCVAGVFFFNNVGLLGMCGHGTIGLAVTLARLGRIEPGTHRVETPVGIIEFDWLGGARVSVKNVPSYRFRDQAVVELPDGSSLTGEIAWGGNWFYLAESPIPLERTRTEELIEYTWTIRQALQAQNITGAEGAEIDHIELSGPAVDPRNDGRNFVLCPGKEYDRSPCGTGTSAKLACLIAEGKRQPGETWKQESITGGVFEATAVVRDDQIFPTITGEAYLTAESLLLFDPDDPLLRAD